MPRRLILASSSESRRRLLVDAGFTPEVVPSHADESGVEHLKPFDAVLELAIRKTRAVAGGLPPDPVHPAAVGSGALVIGCDSMLEFDGASLGKPESPTEAARRWRQMSGRAGILHTGHCVIDTASGQEAAATDSATVRFGTPSERELDAYIATGEPLHVAGAFTLEGRSAPWIEGIEGHAGTVRGLSLAVLRRLLEQLGVELVDLWT
jgi:septum formation protein